MLHACTYGFANNKPLVQSSFSTFDHTLKGGKATTANLMHLQLTSTLCLVAPGSDPGVVDDTVACPGADPVKCCILHRVAGGWPKNRCCRHWSKLQCLMKLLSWLKCQHTFLSSGGWLSRVSLRASSK